MPITRFFTIRKFTYAIGLNPIRHIGALASVVPALLLTSATLSHAATSRPTEGVDLSKDYILLAEATSGKSTGLATGAAMRRTLDNSNADIVTLIAEYSSYRKDLVTIANGNISNAAVKQAHKRLSSHDHKTLSKAWVAYHSAIAARTPAYNKEVLKADRKNKGTFLASLDAQPINSLRLKSSGQAANFVVRSISAETAQLSEMGNSFRKAAMDLQQSKQPRMAINRSTLDRFIDPTRSDNLVLAGANGAVSQDPRNNTKARPMLGQMLTLAAHMSVNEKTGSKYSPSTVALVENRKGERCLKWAKLNLAQCLAATRNTSEEAFCTGRHALTEVSACWSYMATPSGIAS
jgi:hypothetical protein